jgi:hypothetical protein
MKPTQANIKAAARMRAEILREIELGSREFNSEVRHPPMQPEGIPGTPFRAA